MSPFFLLTASARRQRGVASIAITMLMLFILTAAVVAVLNISGSSVVDAAKNEEQVAAFFLAESGLERAQGLLKAATDPGAQVACVTNIPGTRSLGRGAFTLSAVSAGCDASNLNCTSCTVTSTGTVGAASRKIQRKFSLTAGNGGVTCNSSTADCSNASANPPTVPPTWSLTVKNTSANPAVAFLHLAATRQGNTSGASCTAQSNCSLKWNINSQNGARSVLSMGNLYTLDSGATLSSVYQKVNSSRPEDVDVVEAAVLFPGTLMPTVIGAYWNDTNSGSGGTHGKNNDTTGTTNNGAKLGPSVACTNPAPGTEQQCTNWCTGGDTLIFGFSGGSTSGLTDTLTSVLFNTAGPLAQNIPLKKLVHFPTAANVGPPATVYTEIWYAHNPDYLSGNDVFSGAKFDGYVGVVFNGWILQGSKVLTVTSVPQGGSLVVGNAIVGMDPGTTITSFGTGTGSTGTYNVDTGSGSGKQSANYGSALSPVPMQVANNVLTVTGNLVGQAIALNDRIFVGGVLKGTIQSGPSGTVPSMTYNLAASASAAPSAIQTDGKTLSSASSPALPRADPMSSLLRLAVKSSATGNLCSPGPVPSCPAGTTVVLPVSPATLAFNGIQLSDRPTIPLLNAQLCGGTCAFFDHSSPTTAFLIDRPANTDYWASGFACLSGADLPAISSLGSSVQSANWLEVIR